MDIERYYLRRATGEMITECPHCLTRVIPKADGTCPACQKHVRDTRGADPSRTSLRVSQGTVLPAICCDCGRQTERCVTVCLSSRGQQDQEPGFAKTLMALLVGWPVLLTLLFRGMHILFRGVDSTSLVQVKMPQCRACAQLGTPQPRYVDFANARMTFIVHKNLKDAVLPQEGG